MTEERREFDDGRDAAKDAAKDAQREARRAGRDAEREARHAEREARRAARESHRIEFRSGGHGFTIDSSEFDPGKFARSFVGDFVGDVGGESYSDTVEGNFTFKGTPKLRVRNVSGETSITAAGAAGEIRVVARKRVSAGSEDRAKRLLQNLEVRMEQRGEELHIEPHLYEQERGWLDLFRGKRFRVDFEITVPAECAIDAQTVSGEISIEGVRGPLEVQSVSGDVRLEDIQAPMRSILLHTVSGDVSVEGRLDPRKEHRFKSISGDVELALSEPDATIEYRTASGDVECDLPARIVRRGRKEYSVVLGAGQARIAVKTVSGDLTVHGTSAVAPDDAEESAPTEAAVSDVEKTQPMDMSSREEVRSVLERLARGELDVDDAAAALDDAHRGR